MKLRNILLSSSCFVFFCILLITTFILSRKSDEVRYSWISSPSNEVITDQHVLESSSGERRYECHGSCYCDESNIERDSRRNAASVMRSGLTFLVTAISSSVAYRISKEYFRKDCERLLSDCSLDNVKSMVDDCELEELLKNFDKYLDDDGVETTRESVVGEFLCLGYCLPNPNTKSGFISLEEEERIFKTCTELRFSSYIDFEPEEMGIGEAELQHAVMGAQQWRFTPSKFIAFYYANIMDAHCRNKSKEMNKKGVEVELCVGSIINTQDQKQKVHKDTKCKRMK